MNLEELHNSYRRVPASNNFPLLQQTATLDETE